MEAEMIGGLATRIELICQKRGLTYNKLAKELDMSSTTFYQLTSGRTKQLSIEVLIKFHQVLGINIEWLVTGDGHMLSAADQNESEDLPSTEHNRSRVEQGIDDLKRYFEEEIKVKNQQIAGLQRTVDVLVGKSEGATFTQLSEEQKFRATIDLYKQAGNDYASSLLLDKPRPFALFSSAKLVALSLHV